MGKKEKHEKLLAEWKEEYEKKRDIEYDEFVLDGPSDWELYENSYPKILFLAKEAYAAGGFHPSKPQQPVNTKFLRNISRWTLAITKSFENEELSLKIPDDTGLPEFNDSIAIIEVKKVIQGNSTSLKKDLDEFAYRDAEFLKKQIEIIDPQVILCCGTDSQFDKIYEEEYNPDQIREKALYRIEENKNLSAWSFNGRLVIYFVHPSTFPQQIHSLTKNDYVAFDNLINILKNSSVRNTIRQIKERFK